MIREAGPEDLSLVNGILGGDFSLFMSEPAHSVLLHDDKDAMVFAFRGPGIYEVHVGFQVRGKEALALARDMLTHMRSRGAHYFWSPIPPESRNVHYFARALGWKYVGNIPTRDGLRHLYVSEEIPCPH